MGLLLTLMKFKPVTALSFTLFLGGAKGCLPQEPSQFKYEKAPPLPREKQSFSIYKTSFTEFAIHTREAGAKDSVTNFMSYKPILLKCQEI